MSRTKKHRDLFFLRFLHQMIKAIGSPFTHPRASRWAKVRRRVSKQYGGTNWGDKQGVDSRYNDLPYKRAAKRNDRREALQQAHQQLEEYRDEVDYLRRVQIQRDWFASLDEPEEEEFDPIGGYID